MRANELVSSAYLDRADNLIISVSAMRQAKNASWAEALTLVYDSYIQTSNAQINFQIWNRDLGTQFILQ